MNIRRLWRRSQAFDAARQALDEGRLDEAETLCARYLEEDPGNAMAWFNLGLARKLKRDWQGSVEANRRSAELDPTREAFFNLGVAATATRDWASARWAWRGLGLDVGEGDGPPEMDFGPGPVRLNATPDGGGETVWGHRIDPCRMRLESVPTPGSGHRWGDVVLHDVVPRGERRAGGRTFSVFDELDRMDPSPHPTFQVEVTAPTQADARALEEALSDARCGAEDWTSSIEMICAACSLAGAHSHEDGRVVPAPWEPARRFGVGGEPDRVRTVLARWVAAGQGRRVADPEVVG